MQQPTTSLNNRPDDDEPETGTKIAAAVALVVVLIGFAGMAWGVAKLLMIGGLAK